MTRALDLYKRKTVEELHALREATTSNPANKNPKAGSIYIYTPKAYKLLDDIAWAIRYHMDDIPPEPPLTKEQVADQDELFGVVHTEEGKR